MYYLLLEYLQVPEQEFLHVPSHVYLQPKQEFLHVLSQPLLQLPLHAV